MTTSDMTGIASFAAMLIFAMLGAYYKLSDRISKGEAHTEVCNEKHREHEAKFLKQNDINLKADDRHAEIVCLISASNAKLDILLEDRKSKS